MSEESRDKRTRYKSRARAIIEEAAEDADAPVKWPRDIRLALDELTYKQRHFAILIASGLANTNAYIQAYDCDPNRTASDLAAAAYFVMNNDKVKHALKYLREWVDRKWLLEANEAIETCLSKLYEEAEEATKPSDRIAATVAIMKYHGAFVSRSEVRHIHETDPSGTIELLDSIKDMIGLAVPKPSMQIEQAKVETVEFTDAESDSTKL